MLKGGGGIKKVTNYYKREREREMSEKSLKIASRDMWTLPKGKFKEKRNKKSQATKILKSPN